MGTNADLFRDHQVLTLTIPGDIGARDRRRRMLDAIVDAVDEKTIGGTTIADVVGRAHVSRATFYKHFPDKRSCFEAAVDSFLAELREAAEGAGCGADSPPEAIRKASAAVLELLAAKPAHAKLALLEAAAVDPALLYRYRSLLTRALAAQWGPEGPPRRPGAEARAAFGRAQILIFDQIAAGGGDRLPELLPDIVYIALLPFVGPEEALRQAELAR